jgi:hypothetical protein
MITVLLQIDQHDFAVRNHHTTAEHRYSLDVSAWKYHDQDAVGSGIAADIIQYSGMRAKSEDALVTLAKR